MNSEANGAAHRDAQAVASSLISLFERAGDARYDEAVSQTDHALQAAALAERAGADDALVAAALLHDVGHLLERPARASTDRRTDRRTDHRTDRGTDLRHEHIAARWLARWFGPSIVEPIRLHVDAKRYLCAVEPAYHATLSPASVRSLERQGGPMTAPEIGTFEQRPGASAAVELRRWDDLAKDPHRRTPTMRAYLPLLASLVGGEGVDLTGGDVDHDATRRSSTVRPAPGPASPPVHPADLDTRP